MTPEPGKPVAAVRKKTLANSIFDVPPSPAPAHPAPVFDPASLFAPGRPESDGAPIDSTRISRYARPGWVIDRPINPLFQIEPSGHDDGQPPPPDRSGQPAGP